MRRRTFGAKAITVTDFESPKDWGAQGDGVTDDTVAFQKAIDQLPARGGLVVLDEGDYAVASPAGLDAGGRTLFWLLAGTVNTVWDPALPGTILNGDANTLPDGDYGLFTVSSGVATLANNVILAANIADGDHGDFTYSGNVATLDNDVVGPAEIADGDYGDFTFSAGVATLDADVVGPAEIADGDYGDFTFSGGIATLDADVVGPNEIADGDYGDFTFTAGVATLDVGIAETLDTPQATTSGTAFDFTIPSGANKIVVMLDDVSLSGTDEMLIQLGDAGGIEATGYDSYANNINGGTAFTTGFGLQRVGTAAQTCLGAVTLERMTGNTWVAWGLVRDDGAGTDATNWVTGTKSTSGEVTTVRLTRNGTDTFDAGSVNVKVS